MVGFRILTGVSQDSIECDALAGLAQHGAQQRSILTGAITDQHRENQMSGIMTGERQLGPVPQLITLLASAPSIVRRTMAGVQASRIDTRLFAAANMFVLYGSANAAFSRTSKPLFLRVAAELCRVLTNAEHARAPRPDAHPTNPPPCRQSRDDRASNTSSTPAKRRAGVA